MMNRYKTFLRKIGIHEVDWVNPLARVIEHLDYPMARIYRTSVWTGIEDTFDVLVGSHYGMEDKGRWGVLDILIFPLLSNRIFFFFDKYHDPDSVFLYLLFHIFFTISLGPVLILCELSRFLLGIVLTAPLVPVVAAVHAVAYLYKGRDYQKEIQQIKIIEAKTVIHGTPQSGPTQVITDRNLLDILSAKQPRGDLSFVPVYQITVDKGGEEESAITMPEGVLISKNALPEKNSFSQDTLTHLSLCRWEPCSPASYLNVFIAMTEENCSGIGSLLEINAADISKRRDNVGPHKRKGKEVLPIIQQWTKEHPNKALRVAIQQYGFFREQPAIEQGIFSIVFGYAGITAPARNKRGIARLR